MTPGGKGTKRTAPGDPNKPSPNKRKSSSQRLPDQIRALKDQQGRWGGGGGKGWDGKGSKGKSKCKGKARGSGWSNWNDGVSQGWAVISEQACYGYSKGWGACGGAAAGSKCNTGRKHCCHLCGGAHTAQSKQCRGPKQEPSSN